VEAGSFVGNVNRGGSCNCEDIYFNAHGDGTHTECAGHISDEFVSINKTLTQSFFSARLITVTPEDNRVTAESIRKAQHGQDYPSDALIVRTLPNDESKRSRNYSGSNPPWFTEDAINFINQTGVRHLLTDLPSLDREDDDKLLAHHAFFQPNGKWQLDRTVTEMVFVPKQIRDTLYMAEIQIAAFESDASPSRVRIYELMPPKLYRQRMSFGFH
jgi:kynurenine formamidase